jgi:amidophosphoribosyltransferase
MSNAPFGMVLVHNGNLTNAQALRPSCFQTDHRHINTESDSEVLLNVLAHELEMATRGVRWQPDDVFAAVRRRAPAHPRLVCRDRPDRRAMACWRFVTRTASARCAMGRSADGTVMVASESVALEGTGTSSSATWRRARRSVRHARRPGARAPMCAAAQLHPLHL